MSRRAELLNPEGLRMDGRRPHELRNVRCRLGVFEQADGSAYLEQGNTKVLVNVYGPREVEKRHQLLHDRALIQVEYNISTFSRVEKRKKPKQDKRLIETASFIKDVMESVINTQLLPRSQIDIYVQVLQSDGGVLSSAINCVTLAIIDAGVPISDYVCAVSVGYIKDIPFLDINHLEEISQSPNMTLAIQPRSNKIVLLQSEKRIHFDILPELLDMGQNGCCQLFKILDERVKERTNLLKYYLRLYFMSTSRSKIKPGMSVSVIQKQDQKTGKLTRGTVAKILTNSGTHHRGIKVRLSNDIVGRVHTIHNDGSDEQILQDRVHERDDEDDLSVGMSSLTVADCIKIVPGRNASQKQRRRTNGVTLDGDDPALKIWVCHVCTFENGVYSDECEMCDSPKSIK